MTKYRWTWTTFLFVGAALAVLFFRMGVWFERYGSIEVEKAKSVEQTSSEGLPPIDEAMIRYPKGRKGRWVKAEGKVVGFDVDKFQSCKAYEMMRRIVESGRPLPLFSRAPLEWHR